MRFKNREHAASLLADALHEYGARHPLVLGVPRGAIPMAVQIAEALGGDFDVVLVRKLRAPDYEEYAIGAVDEHGRVVFTTSPPKLPEGYLREEIRTQREILRKRHEAYRQRLPASDPASRTVIIVDDGIATGASMRCAVQAVRSYEPREIVVATPVAHPDALRMLEAEADAVVCLEAPSWFQAVGQFYEDFSEVNDEAVMAVLARARRAAGAHG
jgi:predicted phosphoribosyltransferase